MTDAGFAARFQHVLVAEDSAIIAMELEMLLGDLGVPRVSLAASLANALAILEAEAVDAALVDLVLGREDGRVLAAELGMRGIRFAIMTGYGETNELRAAFPDAPVLTKPFSLDDLAAALARLR